eukprot:TRINITY_DN15359_c0_g1_i4.p1 TRINITY_DN15359_c0_g1~~TRINITY_DN15359_c0_g1_i4.p1  ORF type:complete len:281 (+),score=53.36 TRINITY_DN15359_c0_g1_i4:74-916(+)
MQSDSETITESDFAKFDPTKKITNIKDLAKGHLRLVYLFETADGKYVVKKAKSHPRSISNEVLVRSMITDKTLPFPAVLYHDDEIIVEEFVEGEFMGQDEPPSVYKELGKCIRKLHLIKTEKFGHLDGPARGKYATERDLILHLIDPKDPIYKAHCELKLVDIQSVLNKHMHLLNAKESVLIHDDLHNQNILVRDGKLAGVIDFGIGWAGTREQELGRFYAVCGKKEVWESFVEGYGRDFDWMRVKLYAFMFGCSVVARNFAKEGNPDYDKCFQLAKELS